MQTCYAGYSVARDTMYINLQKMISDRIFSDKKVYMFGTSKIASMIIAFLKIKGIDIHGIIDNDEKKQGYIIAGFEVVSPKYLENYDKDIVILIASSYQNEMIDQLEQMGYVLGDNIQKVIDLPTLMEDYSFVDRSGYKSMSEREIRSRQLGIMKYLKNICDENGIDYYLAYGTLLGAVRHSGFIPWDDDVDVYIKGTDIDRLAELINQSSEYEMITCKTNPHYFDQISLIVDRNSVLDVNCFPLQATMGINIDIFPLYGLPSNQAEVKEYVEKLKYMEMEKWNCIYDEKKCHEATLKLNEFISSYDFDKSEHTGFFLSPYFTKDYLKTEYFKNKDYLMYEDEKFCVPQKYTQILEVIYKDYMTLPPENKRGGRHFYKAYYQHNERNAVSNDREYWNSYYNQLNNIDFPSNFARDITNDLKKGLTLVDLGCGNGRDSLYFARLGMNVIAVDMSHSAINKLENENDDRNIRFFQGDFVNDTQLYPMEIDYFYSRFTIHAITEEQQNILIKNVYSKIKKGGKFFIEVRCVLDDIYGLGVEVDRNTYIYEGHSRRFIERIELEKELVKQGFAIAYSEENRHFAPYKDKDPIILRIIAEKR